MPRQTHQASDRSERLTITLGKGQRSRIALIAKKRRTSAATVIRWALDEYIAANTKGDSARRKGADAP